MFPARSFSNLGAPFGVPVFRPRGGGGITTAFDDFNSYTPGQLMSTNPGPGWSLRTGDFIYMSGGVISSMLAGSVSVAALVPSGFTTSANHQVEVILGSVASGSPVGNAHGAACCVQADGTCYHVYSDTNNAYFGYADSAGNGSLYQTTFAHNVANITGFKFRMTSSGSGASRRVTAEIDTGSGYVTPSGWSNVDFGAGFRLDGGDGGIAGFNNSQIANITSVLITNLP